MKKLLLLLIFFCVAIYLPATTIVIYITNEFVIMAADSKGVYTNAKTFKTTSTVVSKIYKSGNIYFSIAGLSFNSARSFDVSKIANAAITTNSNLTTAIDKIKLDVKKSLLTYLTNQKKNNYTLFKQNLASGTFVTSIGFITLKNEKPYAHLLGFRVTDGAQLKITVDEERFSQAVGKDAVYYLGTSGEINRYVNSIGKNNLSPVNFVEKLMNLQIEKTPDLVGSPVDILRITPLKTEWIKRKSTTPIEF